MQMEHSEYIELKEQLQQEFDGRYRKIDDCDEMVKGFRKSINNDNVRLAVIEQQNKLMLWILAAVSGGIIAMLVKMFFGD